MTKKSEIYEKAAKIIEQRNWCKKAYAKDKCGLEVPVTSEHACSFCISGAIIRAIHEDTEIVDSEVLKVKFYVDLDIISTFRYITRNHIKDYGFSLIMFNDEKADDKEDVIYVLKQMAEFEKARENE